MVAVLAPSEIRATGAIGNAEGDRIETIFAVVAFQAQHGRSMQRSDCEKGRRDQDHTGQRLSPHLRPSLDKREEVSGGKWCCSEGCVVG